MIVKKKRGRPSKQEVLAREAAAAAKLRASSGSPAQGDAGEPSPLGAGEKPPAEEPAIPMDEEAVKAALLLEEGEWQDGKLSNFDVKLGDKSKVDNRAMRRLIRGGGC